MVKDNKVVCPVSISSPTILADLKEAGAYVIAGQHGLYFTGFECECPYLESMPTHWFWAPSETQGTYVLAEEAEVDCDEEEIQREGQATEEGINEGHAGGVNEKAVLVDTEVVGRYLAKLPGC